jgi:ribonuclease HII
MNYIIGIDEAGRGPLAGPITLAAFVAPQNLRNKLIKIIGGKIKDSKQFSAKRRKEIYRKFLRLRKDPTSLKLRGTSKVFFCVFHVSNKIIDEKGISFATKLGIKKSLSCILKDWSFFRGREFLANQRNFKIRLDGSLKAPEEFKNQKTIIGGDGKDIFIACASIVSKVRRDRLMRRLAKKYPKYGLEIHKGYGTLLHRTLIKKFGLSSLHRKSFCKNISQT